MECGVDSGWGWAPLHSQHFRCEDRYSFHLGGSGPQPVFPHQVVVPACGDSGTGLPSVHHVSLIMGHV